MTIPMTKARAAEVARQYEAGKSLDTLIAEFKSSYFTVRKAILDNGVKMRTKCVTLKTIRNKENEMRAKHEIPQAMSDRYLPQYASGALSASDLERATGVDRSVWRRHLLEAGVYRAKGTGRWTKEHLRIAIATYVDGSLEDVAKATGFSKTYCKTMLEDAGVVIRQPNKTLGKSKVGNTTSATQSKLYSFGKFQSINLRVSV